MSAIEKLQTAKAKADSTQSDRQNYAAYVEAMREYGWTDEDVAEYRTEVERIMKSGTDEDKQSARDFWRIKAAPGPESGINARIRASIASEPTRRKAA